MKRFLTGIQKDHAKNEREKDKAKAEVERLNRITGSGTASGTASSSVESQSVAKPTIKRTIKPRANITPADQERQWAQLAEMGIDVPDSARAKMAMAGSWQVMSRNVERDPATEDEEKLNVGVRKRKFEDEEEREEAGEVVVKKGWGTTTKTYPGSEAVSEDLDSLLSKPLFTKKKSKPKPESVLAIKEEVDSSSSPHVKQEDLDDSADNPTILNESITSEVTERSSAKDDHETTDTTSKLMPPESDEIPVMPVFKKRFKQTPANVAPKPSV